MNLQAVFRGLLFSWFLFPLASCRPEFIGKVIDRSEVNEKYDYVIVGAGLSGLVVANRLSEDPDTTVLVLEAGSFDKNEDFITIPLLSTGNVQSLSTGARGTVYDWNTTSSLQSTLKGRAISLPAGKVVGGGTVLNGMVFMRGSRSEYDRWEQLGNPGWNFDSLFPYFKKAENFTPPGEELRNVWGVDSVPQYHGFRGFVQSSFANFVWPSTRNYINAMKEVGVSILKDSMGGNAVGAFWFTLSKNPRDESRSTSQAFYKPERPNLHLLVEHQVTKINFNAAGAKGPTVSGVEYARGKGDVRQTVKAEKEVILAAGALHTPQLLMLSGIGNKGQLGTWGIPTLVDLPGVGANHQDHLLLVTVQSINVAVQTGNFSNATWAAEQRALYDEKRQGPFTTASGNFFAFLPLAKLNNISSIISQARAQTAPAYLPSNPHPSVLTGYDAQLSLLARDLLSPNSAHLEFIFGDEVIIPGLQQPFSRGEILLNGTSPFTSPIINPRYLSNPVDIAILSAGFDYARTIRATKAMQEIGTVEIFPGTKVNNTSAIEDFIRGGVDTLNHHSGTAAMMPRDLGGVVDPKLRVYGVRGLRVVDASIVPMLPAAHLQDTIYAVAEKASDMIKNGSSGKDNE